MLSVTASVIRILVRLVIFAALCAGLPARAQLSTPDPMVFGSRYIVAFPENAINTTDKRFPSPLTDRYYIYLYSVDGGNHVTITPKGDGDRIEIDLDPGHFKAIEVSDQGPVTEFGKPSTNTFIVTATKPIVLYCYMSTRFGGEAWTPLPVESWGMEYYAPALPGKQLTNIYSSGIEGSPGSGDISPAPSEILVLAAYNGTHVTISPNGTLRDNPVVTDVVLMAGEAYQVRSFVDTVDAGYTAQPDLGGSRVTADKPIAIISGNTRTQVVDSLSGITHNTYKNMLIEWPAPIEQHGQQFVYLPTVDDRAPGSQAQASSPAVRSNEFVRIYGTSADTTIGSFWNPSIMKLDTFRISHGKFKEIRINRLEQGISFRTNKPASAVMHSAGVALYHDTSTYPGQKKGISYNTWSPYMVDLTPREEWASFAPFIAPLYPPSISHYVNVVADSADIGKIFIKEGSPGQGSEEPFIFNRGAIPGTDLVWGTQQIFAGADYYLRGADSNVRFQGYVYGVRTGYEILRFTKYPEYEEGAAISYGYPLAPSRRVVGAGDTLEIYTERIGCYDMHCRLRIANLNPVGLRSLWLRDGSRNTKIRFLDPVDSTAILRATGAEFDLRPIDTLQQASATLVIMDRTGKYWTVPYEFTPTPATLAPESRLEFGEVRVNTQVGRKIVVRNPATVGNLRVEEIDLASDTGPFRIIQTSKILPASLPPGDSMTIVVLCSPGSEGAFVDTLQLRLQCARRSISMRADGVRPCLQIPNLDFGIVKPNEPKSLPLEICNQGTGDATLIDSTRKGVLTWIPRGFTILPEDLETLKDVTIPPGTCIQITVSFQSSDTGTFTTVARLWADTRACRDTSLWSAYVDAPPPVVGAPLTTDASGYILLPNRPNPFATVTEIDVTIPRREHISAEIFDATGRRVATLVDAVIEPGIHRLSWDGSSHPSGIYHLRIASPTWSGSTTMILTH